MKERGKNMERGTFRPFDTLFGELTAALREAGLDDETIECLTVANPQEAYAIRVRGL